MGSGSSDHGARNCGRTLLAIRIAPKSPDHPQSRYVDIVQAIDWFIR